MKQLLFTLLIIPAFLFANNPEPKKVNWISFEKAIELAKINPKPIIIDVYTDWCGWCHRMDATTYSNEKIVDYINDNYYAVKFNAEQKEVIEYKGETFNFIDDGRNGVHELAYVLLRGNLGYPSTVFLDKNTNYIEVVPGFLQPTQMEKSLKANFKE
ncbi:DUF255 domain-containing protein [Wenyingzhuangia sp. 2_MG-2023]|uniref:thioredoxin family protein n=1 Tax=Wenyingzhuangia sp. 2_MG-2023 TaxID=3062639 RepID=UPI0026E347DC|nr:DUF255 domain-containing protein [Wenyingzhuangia sp. 2_MG-2023]MDO6738238.1 DUF255 domain-containing protein [Wenyingzhuangia sp. 2_MG-2023]